ncbi:MBL fold metallo-hydrolase [Nanoarchaeota archaeon]|nr:MAG: MBL fold metallo-hydrolase [Nanoarchaeota archaeon]
MIDVICHATVKIEDPSGIIIVTDPYQGDKCGGKLSGIKADKILVSHEHYDHFDKAAISSVSREGTIVIGPGSVSSVASKVVKPGDEIEVSGIKIKAVYAYNRNKFRPDGKPFHPKDDNYLGYVITLTDGTRVYFAGDTDVIPEMKELGNITVALLPMSGTYVMDPEEAIEAALIIKPKVVIPMHEFNQDKSKFVEQAKQRGLNAALSY